MTKVFIAYTDGSVRVDPSKKGTPTYGAYGYVLTDTRDRFLGKMVKPVWEDATIGRMELLAAISALDAVADLSPTTKPTVQLFSDSQYCVMAVKTWIRMWEKNGWTTKGGKPVANQDLLETLSGLMKTVTVRPYHVKAHTNKTDRKSVRNRDIDFLVAGLTFQMRRGLIRPEDDNGEDDA